MNPTPQIRTAADVHNALVGMGGRTNDAARYSQGENIRKHANRTVMNQMAAGYCEGVSLDWIRRALLPRVPTDGSASRPRLNFSGDKPERDLRHADAQSKLQDPRNQAQYKAGWDQAFRQRYNQLAWSDAFEAKYRTAGARIQSSNLTQAEKNRRLEQLGEREAEEQDSLVDQQNAVVEAQRAWNNSPTMKKIWWGYSQALDRRLQQEREAKGKQGGPSRGFSRLQIVAAQNARDFAGGVNEFVRTALMDPAFQTNRAAQLVISPPGGANGHAVAILRNNASLFVFFEPNFGTYIFPRASQLLAAMVFLFRDGYPRIEGQGHDAHAYQVNGRASGRYTIFQGRETPVPGPDQILR